jgi:hypothetical protein
VYVTATFEVELGSMSANGESFGGVWEVGWVSIISSDPFAGCQPSFI